MADTYQFSLSDGVNTVTLSALRDRSPLLSKDSGIIQKQGLDGTLRLLTRYSKIQHQLDVNNVSATDAGYVNAWQHAGTTLTYTPDTGSAGTTYSAVITNIEYPLSRMAYLPTIYQGTIQIREV